MLLVLGHAVGFLVPQHVTAFSASPARLLVLEATALVAGLLFAVGLAGMALGRGRVLPQLTGVERLVLALAVLQAVSGVYVATALRWGSSWYVQLLVPWLRSLAALQPDVSAVATMPHAVKAHVLLAVVLLPLLPRTRLPALLLAPVRALRHDVTGRAPRPLEGR
ncbi:MAG: respiratory nitrate reductase subunit gamma [Myxococcales bacterium]